MSPAGAGHLEGQPMQTRQLGTTDLHITPIGFGAWALGGGGWAFSWGPQDDRESIAAIHRALDLGINWIDTAAIYGNGHSEEVVAAALKGRRDRPYVFTKCSLVWDETGATSHSLKAASIRREVEDSLRRLQVDVIDLYQIHWPAQPADGPSPDVEEGWRTLIDLQRAGKVRHIGVSNFNVGHLERARALAPVGSLQPPYSMLRRDVEREILPYCLQHNVGVIVYSPMLSGMLSGAMTRERIAAMPPDDWRKTRNREFQEPRLGRNLQLVERLRAIGARHGRSPGEVAIAWTLRHPAVTGAIVGARSAAQVDGFIGATEFRLGADDLQKIEQALAEASGPAPH
jgi:aryl-alcohol dehydrogenase-like predicted oxidoreductase